MRAVRKGLKLLVALLLANSPLPAQQDSREAMAEKIYLSGRTLMRDKYFQQAVQDFNSLINSYPSSTYADNALLELGKYYYHIERNKKLAIDRFQQIIDQYQGKDTTAEAYYYKGLALSEEAASEQELQDGLANFLRTVQFYPGSLVVEESLYRAGLVEYQLQHFDQAAEYLERCASEYPAGTAAPAAQLQLARALVLSGKVERGMLELQRLRDLYPSRPEATTALHWISLLWRCYYQMRVDPSGIYKQQQLVQPKGAAALESCGGIAFDANRNILFSDPKAPRIYVFGEDLKASGSQAGRKPAGVFIDSRGQPFVADGTGVASRERFHPLSWLKGEKRETQPLEEAIDVVRTGFGDFYVLDGSGGRVLHFNSALTFDAVFAPTATGGAESIAMDAQDRLAVLLKDGKKVALYDRRGKLLFTIAASGPGYSFQDPALVRVDAFGHIYVLDRGLRAVHVFDRQGKLLAQCLITGSRSVKQFAVSDAGEIYAWDDKAAGMWVVR